jgi:serine/threonine protein kinase
MRRLDPERWRILSPQLDAGLEMSGADRRRWLASIRMGDPSLADDLQALLEECDALHETDFLADSLRLTGSVSGRLSGRPSGQTSLSASPLSASSRERGRADEASLAGQSVGDYTLIAPIGYGGMGTVWLARRNDGRFEGHAAVKLLNGSLVGRAGEQRFKREGTILARLAHPSIAHLIDAGVSPGGRPYLVLEYVKGEPIDRYCDDRRLDLHARIRVFLDVLMAVAHAHANLVVHRDIKPSNVLVRTDDSDGTLGSPGRPGSPRVALLDFGIAKLLEQDPDAAAAMRLTQESGWALTPAFAAPEQLTGGAITTATDVYALGVLLYLLLCGQHPAGSTFRSPAELIAAIVDTNPPRPSDALTRKPIAGHEGGESDEGRAASEGGEASGGDEAGEDVVAAAAKRSSTPDRLRRALKGDLDTIVTTALKKDPRERYASVTALADDLRNYLAQRPIRARPDTWTYRTATFVRRHARSVAAAAGITLLLASLTAYHTARLATERDRARREAEKAALEAGKAAKVSELLTGLLTGADPFATRETRGEPTVRMVLDAGAARVQQELIGQPELQAEMLTVIGRVYQRLALHDKAQPLLEQALAVGRRAVGPDHLRVAQSLNDLGVLLGAKGDYAAAIAALEESLAMRRRLLGEEHKDVAVTLVELGRAYQDRGWSERAEPLFRTALAIRRKVFGEMHRETATSLSELGLLLWGRGDLTGADALLRQCLTITRQVLPDDHAELSSSIHNVALVTQARGDHAAAETMFRQSLAIDRKAVGAHHPTNALTLNNLSHSLREQGEHDEAADALEEAMRITRSTRGAEHPEMAMLMVNRARVHLARGDAKAAEPLLARALRIRRRAFPEDDWRIAVTKSILGQSLTVLARYREAEALLVDADRVLNDAPSRQDQAKANIRRLVALYEAWDRPEAAAIYRTRSVEAVR